ncbi:proton-coupled folate transporter-like [Dendronephthya gigantea]|uniref:proton-coupled folate transporter-like n=1 Tax=Dendronephthya gigantea TaxID=151771 RepID=UPI00106C9E4B|nr:proton-coupled folate transporter-like [Dendronephthya gigantea]
MRVVTVEPVAFAYVFALAMVSPLLQQYIYEELGRSYNFTKGEEELCNNDTDVDESITRLENHVQTQATRWFVGLSLSSSLPSVFATFMYGSMSDSTGRKPVMLVATCGSFLRLLIVSLTVSFGWPFYVVFLGSFVEGLTGSFGTITGSCLAYIVDITDDSARTLRLGILELSLVFAATTSFLFNGIWLKHSGYMPPLWASTSLLFIICIYVLYLPESLMEKQSFNKFSCLANAKRIKNFITAKRGPYVNFCLALLVVSFLFSVFDYFGNVTVLFTKRHPLCWGSEMIGYYLATKTASAGIGIVFAFKVLTRCFVESLIVIIGCLSYILSNVIVGFAKTTATMFISCIPAFLAVAGPPCIRSIASKMVEKQDEGALCSVIAVTETIAQLLGSVTLSMLYPVGLNRFHLPGFVFFVQAGLLLIPIILFSIIYYLTQKNQNILYSKMSEISSDTDDTKVPGVQVST